MVVVWIARVVAVVLFVIAMTLWATGVKWFVGALPEEWVYFGAGIPAGIAISLILSRWDERIRRQKAGRANLGD